MEIADGVYLEDGAELKEAVNCVKNDGNYLDRQCLNWYPAQGAVEKEANIDSDHGEGMKKLGCISLETAWFGS